MIEPESNPTPEMNSHLIDGIKAQLVFQRKWQRLSMLAYVASTVSILFCSTAATLAAAKAWGDLAAYLAAATTVLVGLEKSMLFREKWKFHLGIATRLSVLLAELDARQITDNKMIEEFAAILKSYADGLPIAQREEH